LDAPKESETANQECARKEGILSRHYVEGGGRAKQQREGMDCATLKPPTVEPAGSAGARKTDQQKQSYGGGRRQHAERQEQQKKRWWIYP
jgi:hypothetical protein